MVCCFFGHRDTPDSYYPLLEATVEKLITEEGADEFYVGTHGNFDAMALRALRSLSPKYTHIRYSVVLAYLPGKKQPFERYLPEETFYPDVLERTPYRYAIKKRNRWMLDKSSCVICCVYDINTNGAAEEVRRARRKGLKIINLNN